VDIFTNKKETKITLTGPPQKQQIACLNGELWDWPWVHLWPKICNHLCFSRSWIGNVYV